MAEHGVPADTSTLIYLAKADLFREVPSCFGTIVVPDAVWTEAVEAGERVGRTDPSRIRTAAAQGWLRKAAPEARTMMAAHDIATRYGLGRGESQVIAVASTSVEVMLDDRRAIRVASSMGLRPVRTIRIPELGCARGCWSVSAGLAMLRKLSVIVAVRADTLSLLERAIRRRPR